MIPTVLFWCGMVMAVIVGIATFLPNTEDTKFGAMFVPLVLLIAAAVAKYIGY